ncbi:MAG TPA: biotin--[acetyl-CoA-carboxylase] ligase [Pseudolabrys sp.]|nr:biotin--[acetyl-CoA-carboxylase] ligase [Pseudolabrys sp.]
MQLDPAAAAAGVRLAVFDVLDSTNAEARRLVRAGETGPLWVVASRQRAGRGRSGRNWISDAGNLFATLLLVDPSSPARAPELSFVTALAVADAIGECAPALAAQVGLKWPNDVLIGGGKAAGILIEAEGAAVAIGIGINCLSHPTGTAWPATDIAAQGVIVDARDVFAALSAAMLVRLRQWRRGEGFAAVREQWLDRGTRIGEAIRVRLPDRETSGRFGGLDAHGRLLLERVDGQIETVSAGDVFGFAANVETKEM